MVHNDFSGAVDKTDAILIDEKIGDLISRGENKISCGPLLDGILKL